MINHRIVLASRPEGAPGAANFRLEEAPAPTPAAGQFLVRNHYLSLDPYMRGRMSAQKSYAAPQPLGEVMIGGTVGEVVASEAPGFAVGDHVVGMGGWQTYAIGSPGAFRKVDGSPAGGAAEGHRGSGVPLTAYLGAVGMPGVTAWYGLHHVCEAKAGETIAVSAAAGAVGGVVGQLAKALGCRVIGFAGGKDKCAYVVDELGFDACIDYKREPLAQALQAAAPGGIDASFENVGGAVLDAVMAHMNAFGRIAMCGTIAGYNAPVAMADPGVIVRARLKLQGFIVTEHMALWPKALGELAQGVARGTIKYRETVADGLASAPAAFAGLFTGQNFGKQLVRI